jgi:DUF971 family protein
VTVVEAFDIVDVVIDRDRGVLEMTFDDGLVCSLALEQVRRWCPCAACRGRRDQGGEAWEPRQDAAPLAVSDAELAGAWGLSIRWNDGHDTGIYPWASLRRWAEPQ